MLDSERRRWYGAVILLSWLVFFLAGFMPVWLGGGGIMTAVQVGASLLIWGRIPQDCGGMAHHLVREFGNAYLGLSKLSNRRRQPEQFLDRHHHER